MRESDIEKYLVIRVDALGGLVRKLKWIGRRGAPDRFVKLPDKPVMLIELKAPGKVPEPHQEREIKRLRDAGIHVEVVDSKEQVDKILC